MVNFYETDFILFYFNQVHAQFSEDYGLYQNSETMRNNLEFGVHANYMEGEIFP